MDHSRRGSALVRDSPNVFAGENTQRDVSSSERVRGRLLEESHIRAELVRNPPACLHVPDEVVLLLERVVPVGGSAGNDEVFVARRQAAREQYGSPIKQLL